MAASPSSPRPRYSIVIPTYRRTAQLSVCLAALAKLDWPPTQFEVIVVSDEPSVQPAPLESATPSMVEQVCGSTSVRLLFQDHGGPARARNLGAAAAVGEFLLFVDDDCTPAPDWLWQWDLHTARYPDCAAGGWTLNALADNLYSTATHALIEFLQCSFEAGTSTHPFVSSNNLCVPAERFRTLGGFSAVFPLAAGEDRDFCDRWHARGWPLLRVPPAIVYHAHNLTFASFCRQQWNYGRGAFHLHRERIARGQSGRIESAGFYLGLILFPWGHAKVLHALRLSSLLCLSQVVSTAAYIGEWHRSGTRLRASQPPPSRG